TRVRACRPRRDGRCASRRGRGAWQSQVACAACRARPCARADREGAADGRLQRGGELAAARGARAKTRVSQKPRGVDTRVHRAGARIPNVLTVRAAVRRHTVVSLVCREVCALHALGVAAGCVVLQARMAYSQARDRAARSGAGRLSQTIALRPSPSDGIRLYRHRRSGFALGSDSRALLGSRRCELARGGTVRVERASCGARVRGFAAARDRSVSGMKRPQRYLFIIMTVLVAVYLLLTRLPPAAA